MEYCQDSYLGDIDFESLQTDYLTRSRCSSYHNLSEISHAFASKDEALSLANLDDIPIVDPDCFLSEVASTSVSEEALEDHPEKSRNLALYQFAYIPCHNNRIGTLTHEERQLKLQKYKEKRARRSFNKKVSYDCRKRVADKRLRIKGRFVTRDQAISILGAHNLEIYLLEKHNFDIECVTTN